MFEIWPRNRPLDWRRLLPGAGTRVKVVFGPPVQPDIASTAASQDDAYEALTRRLRDAVETMWRRSPPATCPFDRERVNYATQLRPASAIAPSVRSLASATTTRSRPSRFAR